MSLFRILHIGVNHKLFEFKVVTAAIIIVHINHVDVGLGKEFVKQKINKLPVFFGKHNQQLIGMYSV